MDDIDTIFSKTPWLPSLLLHLVLTGSVWMRLTCLYTSTPFLSSLMRPSINVSYHLLPPPGPGSSSALPHAGDWLNGVPSTALGLLLHDQEFHCCLRYWLGTPLHSSAYSCPECHSIADPFGDHQVGCGGNRTGLHVIMPSVTCCSVLPSLLLWHLPRRCPI